MGQQSDNEHRPGYDVFGPASQRPRILRLPSAEMLTADEDIGSLPVARPIPTAVAVDSAYDPSKDTPFLRSLQAALLELANDPSRFAAFIDRTFGTVGADATEALRRAILEGRWGEILPETRIVDFDVDYLKGAYSAANQTIYLQAADPDAMGDTFVEELGHHLHALLTSEQEALNDGLGDEGRIFASQFSWNDAGLIDAINENTPVSDALRREDDVGQIQFKAPDGRMTVLDVEFDAESDAGVLVTQLADAFAAFDAADSATESKAALTSLTQRLDELLKPLHDELKDTKNARTQGRISKTLAHVAAMVQQTLEQLNFTGIVKYYRHQGVRIEVPPEPKKGWSGFGRTDKLGDMESGGEAWKESRELGDPEEMALIRHVEIDYGKYRQVPPHRKPLQDASMGTVDHDSLKPYKSDNKVSANQYLDTSSDRDKRHRSSEWLHMIAHSDEAVITFHDVPGQKSFGFPEYGPDDPAQDPRNLAAGSAGGNTLMIPLEKVGQEDPNKADFKKTVKAYAQKDANGKVKDPHRAALIKYTITHKSGNSRTYLINSEKSSYALAADYVDIERDAKAFFADPTNAKYRGETTYSYMAANTAEDMMRRYGQGGDDLDSKSMRAAVEARQAVKSLAADAANSTGELTDAGRTALDALLTGHPKDGDGEVKFRVDPKAEQVVSWDGENNEIILKGEEGLHLQPELVESRLVLGMLDAKYQSRYDEAYKKTGDDYVKAMMEIEYDIVRDHQTIFDGSDSHTIFHQKWTSKEAYLSDGANRASADAYRDKKENQKTVRRTRRPVFETDSSLAELHDRLEKGSKIYRETVARLLKENPGLQIKIAEKGSPAHGLSDDRTARYDLAANTMWLRAPKAGKGGTLKRMSDSAYELMNAANASEFRDIVQRVQTGEITTAEQFAREILQVEYKSAQKHEQIVNQLMKHEDVKGILPKYTPPSSQTVDEFIKGQMPRKRKNSDSDEEVLKKSLWEHYKGQFETVKQTGRLDVWKPRKNETTALSNSEAEVAVNPEDGKAFLHYWVDKDGWLYGSNQVGADINNTEHKWTNLGGAPVGLPTEQGIHVNRDDLRLYFAVDGHWASAGEGLDNFGVMPVNPEDGKFFLHYYVREDRQLFGSNQSGADINNSTHRWTALGKAPEALPTEELLHVSKDSDSKKLYHNVPGEGWVAQGEGSMWFGGLKDAFGKGPASWLQGPPPFSEEDGVHNLFTFTGDNGITITASQSAGYTLNADRTSVAAQVEVKVTLADGTDVIGNLDLTVDASGHAVTSIGINHGLDENGDGVIGAEALAQAAAVVTAAFQNEAARLGVSAGVGAGANAHANITFKDGVPLGFAGGGGFEVGASAGGEVTVGNDNVSITAGGGAIAGFAAGADVAVGLQEDGSIHLEFEAKLAFLGGFRVHFDFAVDPDAVFELLGKFIDETKTGQELEEFWATFEDSTVGKVVIAAGEKLLDEAVDAFNRQVDRLKETASFIKNAGEEIADSAVVGQVINDVKTSVDAIAGAVERIAGSPAAQAFAAEAKRQIDMVADHIEDSEAIAAFVQGMKGAWDLVDEPLGKMGKGLGNAAKRYYEVMYKDAFEGIGDAFRSLGGSKAFKVFKNQAKDAGKAVGEFADDVGSGLVSSATTAIIWSDGAIQRIVNAGKETGEFFEDAGKETKKVFKKIF